MLCTCIPHHTYTKIWIFDPQIPPYVLVFLSLLAYRVHSIFVLRMFNDPVATCLVYLSINLLLDHHWRLACVCYRLVKCLLYVLKSHKSITKNGKSSYILRHL